MKRPRLTNLFVGLAVLSLAAAPLAASADNGHGGDHDRGNGGYHDRWHSGGPPHDRGYARPMYHRPYADGYFGLAPGGFHGYYAHGRWYHHRRWNGGLWIYF